MKTLREHISRHPFCRSMRDEHLEKLLKNARHVDYPSGEILFREGEPANRLFLVESGKVALETHGEKEPVETIGTGGAVGWSWLFPPFAWHFTARAVEPVSAIVLDGGHLLVTAEEDAQFGYDLMKRIAQIVIHRLEKQKNPVGN